MAAPELRRRSRDAWALARRQHGLLTWSQLIELGFTAHAIKHRVAKGRLRRVHPAVYTVGWGEPSAERTWMAAVLACGHGAVLSHSSAAALWEIGRAAAKPEVTVPAHRRPHPAGVRAHRSATLQAEDATVHCGIPVTTPIRTLIDLATRLSSSSLEAAINAADKRDLVDPDGLRAAIESRAGQRGVPHLRRVLDYHRTRAQQAADKERDSGQKKSTLEPVQHDSGPRQRKTGSPDQRCGSPMPRSPASRVRSSRRWRRPHVRDRERTRPRRGAARSRGARGSRRSLGRLGLRFGSPRAGPPRGVAPGRRP